MQHGFFFREMFVLLFVCILIGGCNGFLVGLLEKPHNSSNCSNFYNSYWVCNWEYEEIIGHSHADIGTDDVVSAVDQKVFQTIRSCEKNAPYHLDYISHLSHELHRNQFCFDFQKSTTIYVLDTWVDEKHEQFENRLRRGKRFNSGNSNPHGTHVAALVMGKSVGVNKRAKAVSVQVLDDTGHGRWSDIIAGLAYVSTKNSKYGIINISIAGPNSPIVLKVLKIMEDNGWRIVVAAGNNNGDACMYSPANSPNVITVGSSNENDFKSSFSNHGKCVDVWAPGESIISAYPGSRYAYMSGTSMAAPLVAGLWSSNNLSKEVFKQKCTFVSNIIRGIPYNQNNLFAYCPVINRA